jgi:deferrochelatase/peroxidase EfeB
MVQGVDKCRFYFWRWLARMISAASMVFDAATVENANDAMNEYLRHTSSGLKPFHRASGLPGFRESQYPGQQLFES